MKCPNCGNRNIDVNKADGFSKDTRECMKCGMIWTFADEKRTVIKEGKEVLLG